MPNKAARRNLRKNATSGKRDIAKQLLSVSEGAQLLNISPSSLRRLESEGKINSIRKENGYRAFRRTDIETLRSNLEEEKIRNDKSEIRSSTVISHKHISEKSAAFQNLISKINAINTKQERNSYITAQSTDQDIQPISTPTVESEQVFAKPEVQASAILKHIHFNPAYKKPNLKILSILAAITLITGAIRTPEHIFKHKASDILGQTVKIALDKKFGKDSTISNVLAAKDRNANWVFAVNIPAIFRDNVTAERDLSVNGNLNVAQLATLSGGLTTNNQNGNFGTGTITAGIVDFVGTGSINNLKAINDTTKDTLEAALDINGDVTSTGMLNTKISKIGGITLGTLETTNGYIMMINNDEIQTVPQTQITSLGTITAGVWQGTTIDPTHGGTGLTSYTAGDLIIATGTNTLSTLGISGVSGYILTSSGTAPSWQEPTSFMNDIAWALTGNEGTTQENNFIGTTDNTGLSIRTNDTERVRITNTGRIGIATTNPSTTLHVGDGSVNPAYVTNLAESQFIEGSLEVAGTIYGTLVGVITTTGFDPNGIFFADSVGTMTNDNTQITWNQLTSQLTVNGASTFSGFTTLGGGVTVSGGALIALDQIALGDGNETISFNGSTMTFSDSNISSITLTQNDTVFASGDTALVDAINSAYEAATGGGDGTWSVTSGTLHPTSTVQNLAVGGSDPSNAPFFMNPTTQLLTLTNTTSGDSFRINDQSSDTTPFIINSSGNVGIGTTNPGMKLDVIGDARVAAGSDFYIGTLGLNDIGTSNVTSGASLIGVFDEFTYSNSTTVQDVLDDLDSQIGGVAGDTHPALQLAGTATYLSLNTANQVLTQSAIDLSNSNNVTNVLSATNGGLGIDGATAPAGTLILGTGTGFNIRAMGGDATVASNGTLTLANTGVSSGTYGSTGTIPVLNIDAKGRVIGASTAVASFEQTLSFNNPLSRIGNTISLDTTTTATTSTTASNSGLEVDASGLRMIGGCANNGILSWDSTLLVWKCSTVGGIGALSGSGTANYVARWLSSSSLSTGTLYDTGTQVGIGTTNPTYMLDINGDTRISSGSDLHIGTVGLTDTASPTTSGAYLIGVNDEFTYSNSANVQAVLNDLDSALGTTVGNTHPALQLAGTANYLSLNAGNQVLTQGTIDLSNSNNVTNVLSAVNGGLGIDGSTSPAGTLLLGTGTGFNIRAMGGDATIAANGTLTLANTGVTANTYGSSTGIPVITVDAKGRLTSASTAPLINITDGTGIANYIARWSDNNTLTTGLAVDNGTSFGIGNTNPSYRLDVRAPTIGGNGLSAYGRNSLTGNLEIIDDPSDQWGILYSRTPNTTNALVFGSTQHMSINNNTITSAQNQNINTTYNGTGTINTLTGISNSIYNYDIGKITNASGIRLDYQDWGGETGTYKAVNIVSPALYGTAINVYGVYIGNIAGATRSYAIFSEGGTNYLGGSLGIGTSTPDASLHVKGGDAYFAPESGYTFNNSSSGEDLYVYGNIETDGVLYASTAALGQINIAGDIITDLTGNGLTTSSNALTLDVNTTATTSTTASNSGLEVAADGLRLLGGCGNNEVMVWDSTLLVWRCSSVSGVGAVSGTGITNYIARWTSSSALGTGILYDNGTNVGVGTTNPTSKLALAGGNFTHTASGNPTLAGTYNTSDAALGLHIVGRYAYVADENDGLHIINIANPTNPTLVSSYNTPDVALGVRVVGKYAYVADDLTGLIILDVSRPDSPTLVNTINTPGQARKVEISGKYAYVADYGEGLQIIDISNPYTASIVGNYNTSGSSRDVFVHGKYAYVADNTGGLHIIDVSDPTNPTLTGTYNTGSPAYYGVSVSGKYAYVADSTNSNIRIIDISNPASPTLTGSYNVGNIATKTQIAGDYLYVSTYTSGLIVLNVATPATPVLVGSYDTSGLAYYVQVAGKYAYVADAASGLQIVDINGIETPSISTGALAVGTLNVTEDAIFNNKLYVNNGINIGTGGLQVSAGEVSFDTNSTAAALKVTQRGTGDIFNLFDESVEVLTVLNGGNVGVGTTTPDSKLHLAGGDMYLAPDSGYSFNNASSNEDLYVYGNIETDGVLYASTAALGQINIAGDIITDFTGNGLTTSSNALTLDVTTTATTGTTASNSGLEVSSDGLRLVGGCGNNEVLIWDSTLLVWRCSSVSGVGALSGSGTTNYTARWNGSGSLTTGTLFDNGTRLGIGNTNPQGALTINSTDANALLINPFGTNAGETGELRFSELVANGANYTGFKAPSNLSQDIIYTLPSSTAPADYVLTYQTDGSLQWKEITGVGGAGDITSVGSMSSSAAFTDTSADEDWLGLGAAAGRVLFRDQATDVIALMSANVGIGTTAPQYTLDINGNAHIASGSDLLIGTIGLNDLGTNNTTSGASLAGVYDEFTYSNGTTVQAVLKDLDTQIGNIAGDTHPALQLAGTANYLTLGANQVLTQTAIDISSSNNVTNVLGVSNGGLGIDASTSPAGTLVLGTGTGLNVRTMGGDATISSNGTLTLANSGVSAATYGSPLGIPVITIDAKGRITAASTALANFEQTLTFSNPLTRSGTTIGLDVTTTSTTSTTASNSGLEIAGDGLRLLGGCANNEVMVWDATLLVWRCSTVSGVGAVSGSGTTNYLAKWTGSSSLGTGLVYDTGTYVGIGTTNPTYRLDVQATALANNGLNVYGKTDINGKTTITNDPTDMWGFQVVRNVTGTLGTKYNGFFTLSVGAGTTNATNMYMTSSHTGTNTVSNLTGTYNYMSNSSTGNISNAYGMVQKLYNGDGIIYNYQGVRVETPENWATLVNSYGIYIGAFTNASTRNYSLFAEGGTMYSGGSLGVGTSTPDASLHIRGGDGYFAPESGYTFNNASGNEDLYVFGNIETDGVLYASTAALGQINISGDAIADLTGNGLTTSSNALTLDVTTTSTTSTTASNSGLEVSADGVRLLGGCANNEVMVWDSTLLVWRCSTVAGVGGVTGSGATNYVTKWTGTSSLATGILYDTGTYIGVGTTNPTYTLDINGDARIASGSDLHIGTIGLTDTASPTTSGAYLIGANDEFAYSASTTVQGVLNDLDAALGTAISGTHPALQLAGTANYLTLGANQVLTQGAIDISNSNNVTNVLSAANGGLGVDASTSPAGTLVLGTGTGLNVRTMGGDATIASNGTLTLANTGVTAATYGSGSSVPVLTIDAKGRITSASTAMVESPLTFNNPLIRTGNSIDLDITTTGTTSTTASNSGFEIAADGLRLIGGCANNEVMVWDSTLLVWRCSSVSGVGAVSGTGTNNYVAKWTGTSSIGTGVLYDNGTNVGIGTTNPTYTLDVNGNVRIASGSDLHIGTIGFTDTASPTTSGAYLIGVNDEFAYSSATNVQAVLNDLDAALATATGGTHPALQLAGTANYLSLDAANQVLTQTAIDISSSSNVTNVLSATNGGLGVNASTSPAGTLVLGTGTGLNIRSMGGDATIASNGTLTLANSGVSAATYGSSLGIPVIAIDAKGRITAASTALANFEQTLTFSNPLTRSDTTIGLDVTTTSTTSTTASNSGLEIAASGLRLLGGCGNNEVMAWDATLLVWKCTTVSGVGAVSGSGATNYVARWTGASSLGTGALIDTGSAVGINTSPTQALSVAGNGLISGRLSLAGEAYDATSILRLGSIPNAGSGIHIEMNGTNQWGVVNNMQDTGGTKVGFINDNTYTVNTNLTGYYNNFDGNGTVRGVSNAIEAQSGTFYGIENTISSFSTGGNTIYGTYNNLGTSTENNTLYGTYSYIASGTDTDLTYGSYIEDETLGASKHYGYYYNNIGETVNSFGIYLNNETRNYISGNLGLGTSAPSEKIDVVGGNIKVASGYDYHIGTIGLTDTASPTASGAYLIGTNDEFAYSSATNVQAVLNDLDAALGTTVGNTHPALQLAGTANYISLNAVNQVLTQGAIDISSSSNVANVLSAANGGFGVDASTSPAGTLVLGTGTGLNIRTMGGDATIASNGTLTLATVNSNTGTFGSGSSVPVLTLDAKGRVTAASTAMVESPLTFNNPLVRTGNAIDLDIATTATTATTASNSGLEVSSDGVRMLGGCSNGQSLVWNSGNNLWECSTVSTGSGIWTDGGATTYLTSLSDSLAIGGTTASDASFYFSVPNQLLTLTNTTSGNSFVVNDAASDTTPFIINASGSVGIGTTSAYAQLNVIGTTEQLRLGYNATNYGSFTVASNGDLTMAVNGTNSARFGSVNNEFYLPTSFSAAGDAAFAYDLVMTNQTASAIKSYGPLTVEAGESFENNNLTLKTYGTGSVVISGSTSPSSVALDVIGNGRFSLVGSGTYSNNLNITSDGTLTTATSDARLKTDFNTLSAQETLAKVMQLNPITFSWINDTQHRTDIGFTAQEMEEIFPEVTFTNTTDGYKGINYTKLAPILTSAVQALNTNVEDLSQDVLGAQSDITSLKQDVTSIKEMLAIFNAETSQSTDTTNSSPVTLLSQLTSLVEQIRDMLSSLGLSNQDGTLAVTADMNVIGNTTLFNTTVTGNLAVGMVEIDSLRNAIEINAPTCFNETTQTTNEALCEAQTLFIQKNLAGNLDLNNGALIVKADGTVEIKGTVKATKVVADEYAIKGTSDLVGNNTIPAGTKEIMVENLNVKDNSKIFVTATSSTGGQALVVSNKSANQGFTVSIDNTTDTDITFDWWLINID